MALSFVSTLAVIIVVSYGFDNTSSLITKNLHTTSVDTLSNYVLIENMSMLTWSAAEIECEMEYGTTLATVITQEDMREAVELVGNDLSSVPVGLFRNILKNSNNWQWINGISCDYTGTGLCGDDLHWEKGQASMTKPHECRSSAYITNETFYHDSICGAAVLYSTILCNAPNGQYHVRNCSETVNCWTKMFGCNDTTLWTDLQNIVPLQGKQPIAYWDSTFFVVGADSIHYTNIQLFDNAISWHTTIWNEFIHEYFVADNLYVQHESSVWFFDVGAFKLFHIDLNNLNVSYYSVSPYELYFLYGIDCIVATHDHVYLYGRSLLIFNINSASWETSTHVTELQILTCSTTNDEKFIYLFTLHNTIVKYDIMSGNPTILNTTNLCNSDTVQLQRPIAVTAGNNKIYLHGCDIASWRTLVFNPETDEFESNTIDIDIPSDTSLYRTSGMTRFDDNVLLLMSNDLVVYSVITDLVSINFTDTASNIWASNGIDIKYYLNDFANTTNTIYPLLFHSAETINVINVSVILNTSRDHCICNELIYKCRNCYQHFPLNNYLSVMDNQLDEITLFVLPDLLYGIHPLILRQNMTITLKRCILIFGITNTTTTTYEPTIIFSFNLSSDCQERPEENFTLNITSDVVNIRKELHVNIKNSRAHEMNCMICDLLVKQSCSYCNNYTFSIQHETNTLNDDLKFDIDIVSNMVDFRVIPSGFTVQYFDKKGGDTKIIKDLLYLLLLLIIPIIMTFIIYKYCRNQYMNDVFIVNKALVLLIGISQFDVKHQYLPNVKNCVAQLIELWSHMYNYDVFVYKEKSMYATKSDVIDFVDTQIAKLNKEYDCIIVHILSHGSKEKFYTSDGKTINLDFLVHEIQDKAVEIKNLRLLKLIVNHGCQGGANYINSSSKHMNRSFLGMYQSKGTVEYNSNNITYESNFKIISGNVPGRTMSDSGNFTQCIYQSFSNNLTRNMKWTFDALIKEIRRDLETKTDHAELVTVALDTICYNAIRFEKHSNDDTATIGTQQSMHVEFGQMNVTDNAMSDPLPKDHLAYQLMET
eukprot:70688_1